MSLLPATYNERSWAIDLIGHLKHLTTSGNRTIKDAGGEQTIKTEGGSLFPDVLLFGDKAVARILQGWELKMPDTSIDDPELRRNAEIKARALGLDSFLLWNVSVAQLFILDKATDTFIHSHQWSDLADITTRTAVVRNRNRWESLAEKIFDHLNDLLDQARIQGRQFIDAYRSGGITALIMENAGQVAEALAEATKRDLALRAEIALWWGRYQKEYASGSKEYVLAQAVISNWIGKILFSHVLREKDVRAQRLIGFNNETSPAQALKMFKRLSQECNFWTIFSDSIGLHAIPASTWQQLKQFDSLLSDLRIGSIDQSQLSRILEATVEVAVRKLRGQYPTPPTLARILTGLCIKNTVDDRVLDPCCGSGTLARAAIEQKLASKVPVAQAAATVFASDLDPQAIQIATFALAKPNFMNIPLRIFQRDAFELTPDTQISFQDPANGKQFTEQLGRFQAVISNLPFVAQSGRKQYVNALGKVAAALGEEGARFTGRADIAAYLPFSLHPLLTNNGRLGIIITNAWLGTDWGYDFYTQLQRFYDLKCVVTSGAGRWFQNSEVVTNILVAEKRSYPQQENSSIKFIVLKRPLDELTDDQAINLTVAQIELGQTHDDTMTIREIDTTSLEKFRTLGLAGNAQFVDCDWLLAMPLVPLKSMFKIRRGERRGKNQLFYPSEGHGIEPEYIRPLAKSPSEFTRLSSPATKEAFCCSRTLQELKTLGHSGALNWIKRFETTKNVAKLQTQKLMWYEMKADTLTDLVMFIAYGQRLFVGRVTPPAFVDQRLVRLEPLKAVDVDLMHALLNSTISMFIIEGMGFGRGLGALDLNKERIEDFMHMLDPTKLDQTGIHAIKTAFAPLLKRNILDIADELEQVDRQTFDDTVIAAFRLKVERQRIYDALLALVEIRLTALAP